jgi:hypothetical protein
MYTYVQNIIAKTMNIFHKTQISMPYQLVVFLFENSVQHSPVLSQFVSILCMIHIYYILVDLFPIFLYSLVPGPCIHTQL